MAVFPVVLDANVLYGILPTDLLITTAASGLYRAHWTREILDEARRNVLGKRRDLAPAAVHRRFELMTEALPEAMLDPPPSELVEAMQNDPGDRHVLAAAVSIGAEVIVTENTRHFSQAACLPHGVETRTLDQFVSELVSLDAHEVWRAIGAMAGRRQRPPMTVAAICAELERYVPGALQALRDAGFGF